MRKIGVLVMALAFVSCKGKTTETTETTTPTEIVEIVNEPNGLIFRSDGFHNGIASEFLQVAFTEQGKVDAIWYWDTNNKTPKSVEIKEQRIGGDESTAVNIGKLKFAGNPFIYEFKIQEELFSLIDDEGRTQEFDLEME